MLIIGCDYHPSMQQIAYADTETGEGGERRLMHRDGEAERFYRELKQRQMEVRVGMEATGYARWFERLLAELGFELWIGDPARIRARRVRKQKTDRKDAQLLLRLLLEGDGFPRIWVPSPENRDLRQLLWHRHRLVQMRTRIMNQLQAVAMNEGLRRKRALWSESGRKQLESFLLAPWATRRRARSAGAAGPVESHDPRVNRGGGKRSREQARGAIADESSWRRAPYGASFRADHRDSRTLSVRQTDG
jgi:transposase